MDNLGNAADYPWTACRMSSNCMLSHAAVARTSCHPQVEFTFYPKIFMHTHTHTPHSIHTFGHIHKSTLTHPPLVHVNRFTCIDICTHAHTSKQHLCELAHLSYLCDPVGGLFHFPTQNLHVCVLYLMPSFSPEAWVYLCLNTFD